MSPMESSAASSSCANKSSDFNLVLMGCVDSGKSTLAAKIISKLQPELFHQRKVLIDQLIQRQKHLQQRFYPTGNIPSWLSTNYHISALMLEDQTTTIGISVHVNAKYLIKLSECQQQIRLIDTPGHGCFSKNAFRGIFMGTVCLMVVSGDEAFECGFPSGNLSFTYQKQLIYAKVAGIQNFIVCINSMDRVNYSEKRFLQIKSEIGKLFKNVFGKEFPCIPISAEQEDNVFQRSRNTEWYSGKTLIENLNDIQVTTRSVEECLLEPLRIAIYKSKLENNILVGYIVSGMIKVGMTVQIPQLNGELIKAKVKTIQISHVNKQRALANSLVGIEFDQCLPPTRTGYIISNTIHPCKAVSSFTAQITILNSPKSSIHVGYAPNVKCGLASANIKFTKLLGILSRDMKTIVNENPSCLTKGDRALVELTPMGPLFVDDYNNIECNKLGLFIIQEGREIIAVGKIIKVVRKDTKQQSTLFRKNGFDFVPFRDVSIRLSSESW